MVNEVVGGHEVSGSNPSKGKKTLGDSTHMFEPRWTELPGTCCWWEVDGTPWN